MMKFSRSMLFTLALTGLAFGGVAFAQAPAQTGKSQDNTQQLMQSYRQKTQQLQGIQQKAIKNTPKLAAEMKQFRADVNSAMRAHGYDVTKGRKRVEAMASKLKSGKKVSKAERMAAMKSFQAERQKMMKARTAAMQDPKIQKAGKALQSHMIAAMKKQDSHTAQLLKDVKSLRTKIMASMAARRAAAKKGS
jgi:hypothetical protein